MGLLISIFCCNFILQNQLIWFLFRILANLDIFVRSRRVSALTCALQKRTQEQLERRKHCRILTSKELIARKMKPVNVSDTSVSKASISINFYIVGLGGVVMFFIGIVTNTLNLLLLTRKSMKSTTNKYLSALAVSDTLVLIFSTVITSNSFISDYDVASFESNAINNVIDLLHIATGLSHLLNKTECKHFSPYYAINRLWKRS